MKKLSTQLLCSSNCSGSICHLSPFLQAAFQNRIHSQYHLGITSPLPSYKHPKRGIKPLSSATEPSLASYLN